MNTSKKYGSTFNSVAKGSRRIVPEGVPSLRHSSTPPASLAVKQIPPFKGVSLAGLELPELMSRSMMVPDAVPSLRQISFPVAVVAALKNRLFPATVRLAGIAPPTALNPPFTKPVPPDVPSLFQSS